MRAWLLLLAAVLIFGLASWFQDERKHRPASVAEKPPMPAPATTRRVPPPEPRAETPAETPAEAPAETTSTASVSQPADPTAAQVADIPDWAGSESCKECHPDLYQRWSATGHALSIRPFSPDIVARKFDGEVFTARDIDNHLGPGAQMTCEGPGGELQHFPIQRVIGLRRVQMFTTQFDRGRIQVLPVFIEVPEKRWFDYTDFIFGKGQDFSIPPDSAYSWYGPHRNFNSRCGRCHATDYEIGYDPDTGSYDTKWSELRIGCESCHGPAGGHVRKWQQLSDGPDPVANPAKMTVERANQVCGQCHAEATMVHTGYRPGDDFFDYYDAAGIEDTRHLFPDGRASELIHNLLPNMESRCGPLACTKCHDPHGRGIAGDIYRPLTDDTMCTQCHAGIGNEIEKHTHHPAASEGSRCVRCHMQQLVIEGGHGKVFDHTISIPSVKNTKDYGLPNACRSCHLTEYPGWEYEPFAKWYPDAEKHNHRVPLAAAFAAARRRDPKARELLLPYLKDPNPVYRAGAAMELSVFRDVDLRPMLGDPHPFVRNGAINGVSVTHPDALVPLLDDTNHVLRRAAAMVLATKRVKEPYDWIAARPELRAKLITVLTEYAAQRPDNADLHYVLSRLLRQEGRTEEAEKALHRYHLLTPWR